ncbi:hypothetical protein L2164_00305 [Pectobacterium brasiliense]|uniref:hypothetical protein n=1 Tax=Pectobacterium brasiliense TaxID=180957 RepID=UPI0006992656|nr:hypothetical protein [Pectobacterium brasiliense]MCG5047143.1 hypothetical protein [Pectobacterium brasiliense]
MLENGKLTFWDLGTYLTVGFFVTSIFSFYSISIFDMKISDWIAKLKDYSALFVILFPVVFLFSGMCIEPLANWFIKKLEDNICFFNPKESRNKKSLEELIISKLPDVNISSVNKYRYCKAVVELKFRNSNHDVFLARFGFYRSMSFLMAVLFVLNLMLITWSCRMFFINVVIFFMFCQFIKRSQDFKNHMEDAVYYNYLALMNTSDNK